jgi:hypothetical protein
MTMKSPRRNWIWRGLFLCGALALGGGCEGLDQALANAAQQLSPPTVTLQSVTLAQSPSQASLAAFYCPDLVAQATGTSLGADFACQQFFGPIPSQAALQFGFDVRFSVANPNHVPLPLSEILTAVKLFPDTISQNLGAICLHLCAPDDPACQSGPTATGCQSSSRDIKSLNDFVRNGVEFLVVQGLSDAAGQPLPFVAPRVLAGSSLDVTTRFSIAPTVLLPVLQQLAQQSADQLTRGTKPRFAIPYNLEGTVFVDAGSLGRVAASFGPLGGEWVIPTENLVR